MPNKEADRPFVCLRCGMPLERGAECSVCAAQLATKGTGWDPELVGSVAAFLAGDPRSDYLAASYANRHALIAAGHPDPGPRPPSEHVAHAMLSGLARVVARACSVKLRRNLKRARARASR